MRALPGKKNWRKKWLNMMSLRRHLYFVTIPSKALEQFLNTMCKSNVREGAESFATIGAVVLEILRKDKK